MTLQRINWTQIDTANVTTGSTIDLGSETNKLNAVHVKTVDTNSITVSGDTQTETLHVGSIIVIGTSGSEVIIVSGIPSP